jgi:hypothetical protein
MEQTFEPTTTATAGRRIAPAAEAEDTAIRISELDSWTASGTGANDFCFFCLAVPTDEAVRAS